MTSAAGKCLIKMGLPLARREPSPTSRRPRAVRLVRRCPTARPKPCPIRSVFAEATRARFEFVGRAHGKRIHPQTRQPDLAAQTQLARGEQFQCRLAVAGAVLSRASFNVKKRMTLAVIFLIFSLRGLFPGRENHVPRFPAPSTAVFDVESEIILDDIVAAGKAKLPRSSANRGGRPFEFDKCADGSLIDFD